jgi:uncharacterized protein YecE (DUF72 family)
VRDNEEEEVETPDLATPTPDARVEQEEVIDDDDEEEDPSLREHLNTPSKISFHELAVRYRELKGELTQLKKKVDEITLERDKAIAYYEHVRREHGALAIRVLASQEGRNVGAPTVEARIQKSVKMPDAPILSDGKLVRFET